MVIYNNKKEFLGIDKDTLESLGFSSLAELQSEAADFGDLFIKTPGHVHNFKHVHWIDFVLCEDEKNACKVIIHAKGKNLSCVLEIKTLYLTSSPNSKSYIINFINLRNLTSTEINNISSELQTRVSPIVANKIEENRVENEENEIIDIPTIDAIDKKSFINDPYETKDDLSLDSYELSQEQLESIGEPDIITSPKFEPAIEIDIDQQKEESNEIAFSDDEEISPDFDIKLTAQVLEMDEATIKDFVNDFITQAKEFKSKLYNSVAQEDLIILKSLSHQLKGVAANLRIHHCQEILIKINKADDFTSSKADLDIFYKLIAKLSGEEIIEISTNVDKPKAVIEDDDYIIEVDESLSSQIKSDNKPDFLETQEDDYILEIENTLVNEPKNENKKDLLEVDTYSDDIIKIDDIDSPEIEKDKFEEENIDELDLLEKDKSVQIYDKAKIADEIGLDEQGFNELFQEYLNESQDLISTIEVSINTQNSSSWKHAAIQLKGMSDNMRIDSFTSNLKTLISTNDKDKAQIALKQIESILSQIIITKD